MILAKDQEESVDRSEKSFSALQNISLALALEDTELVQRWCQT